MVIDPVSIIFASYIEMISSSVSKSFSESKNIQTQIKQIKFEDFNITYSYQFWKIKQASVCNNYKQEPVKFSKCTLKAKELFRQSCSYLQKKNNKQYKLVRLSNMYCNASLNFKPQISIVSEPKKKSPYQIAEQECNVAIMKSMGSSNEALVEEKNNICKKFESYTK